MKKSSLQKISAYLLILAVVVSGVSQVIPWGKWHAEEAGGGILDWYSWGWHSYSPKSLFEEETWKNVFTGEIPGARVSKLAELIRFTFPLSILSLIIAGIAIYNVTKRPNKKKSGYASSLSAGIISVLALIFYVLAVNDINTKTGLSSYYGWVYGLFLFIISFIIFFICAGMISYAENLKNRTK